MYRRYSPFPLTLSLGVALLPDDAAIADVITAADNAMYHAKHSGRNRVCLAAETAAPQAALTAIL